MSRELHDDLAQTLTGMSLFAASLELSTEGEGHETAKKIGSMAADAAEAIRRLIFDLRPLELEDGLVDATHRFLEVAGERRGKEIGFALEGTPRRLDREVEATVYRIAQESLNNVVKHAPEAEASLSLSLRGRSHRGGHPRIGVPASRSGRSSRRTATTWGSWA